MRFAIRNCLNFVRANLRSRSKNKQGLVALAAFQVQGFLFCKRQASSALNLMRHVLLSAPLYGYVIISWHIILNPVLLLFRGCLYGIIFSDLQYPRGSSNSLFEFLR